MTKTKTFTTHRRGLFGILGTGAATAVLAACGSDAQAKSFPVARSEAEWKKRLTKAEFTVLRQEGTERPYSSPLNEEKRKGVYACAGCGNAVYSSRTKFESGTGWPSFWARNRPASATASTAWRWIFGRPDLLGQQNRALDRCGHAREIG